MIFNPFQLMACFGLFAFLIWLVQELERQELLYSDLVKIFEEWLASQQEDFAPCLGFVQELEEHLVVLGIDTTMKDMAQVPFGVDLHLRKTDYAEIGDMK